MSITNTKVSSVGERWSAFSVQIHRKEDCCKKQSVSDKTERNSVTMQEEVGGEGPVKIPGEGRTPFEARNVVGRSTVVEGSGDILSTSIHQPCGCFHATNPQLSRISESKSTNLPKRAPKQGVNVDWVR